ncbi:NAD(P)-binding domain-containing protein [Streptomyces sp. NPDC001750]|uniref:NAD(P)-binding domain-containing protein n=1 Tax=unclassified Streptomyces TaxID=2593676 RepID=UPI0036D1D366
MPPVPGPTPPLPRTPPVRSRPDAAARPAPTLRVAVLGTGITGSAMARGLLRAGLDVHVRNRTRANAASLAADGATVAERVADAVRGANVVLTMLVDGLSVAAAPAAEPGLGPGQVLFRRDPEERHRRPGAGLRREERGSPPRERRG